MKIRYAFIGLMVMSGWATAQTKAPASAQTKAPAKKAAAPAAAFKPALLNPASLKAQAPAEFEAKFVTTKGDFVIIVTREPSPNGADRFYNLVKNGYYDNATFFRAIAGFMVQFGISAHPEVSKQWREANVNDDPVKGSNKKGFISFAMRANPPGGSTRSSVSR